MAAYLPDTNHAARIMGSEDQLATIFAHQANDDDRFFISMTVLGELYFAAYASSRQVHNLQNLADLLTHIPLLDYDQAAAEEYGRINAELKVKGRPIPGTDAQIAAVARVHTLIVLTSDRHFQVVDNLQVENWF